MMIKSMLIQCLAVLLYIHRSRGINYLDDVVKYHPFIAGEVECKGCVEFHEYYRMRGGE